MEELLHRPTRDLARVLCTPSLSHSCSRLGWREIQGAPGTIAATARASNRGEGGRWRSCDLESCCYSACCLVAAALHTTATAASCATITAADVAPLTARGCAAVPKPCATRSTPGSGSCVPSHHATTGHTRFGHLHGRRGQARSKVGGGGPPLTLLLHCSKLEARHGAV
jgi:hypothetical protein